MLNSPDNPENIRPLSALLLDIKHDFRDKASISGGELLEAFHERGFGFFLFLFALPGALPLPPMGMSIVTGLPMLLLTFQQTLGFHTIWVPKKMRAWTLPKKKVDEFIDIALPFCQKLEKYIRPRWGGLTQGAWSHVIGFMGMVMSFSVLLPIPFTNTVPGIGVVLMSVGVLMRDGLAVVAGAIIGGVWSVGIILLLIFFGIEGLSMARDFVVSFF